MLPELKGKENDKGAEIAYTHALVAEKLIAKSVEPSKIADGEIRSQSSSCCARK